MKDWQTFSDSLIQSGTPFTAHKTSMSIKFFTPISEHPFKFYAEVENPIPRKELYFLGRVKSYCESLDIKFSIDRQQIRYNYMPRIKPGTVINDCIEIDLSSAYWNFAHREGIISNELFEMGKSLSKKTRLASLGNLAKLIQVIEFDGRDFNLKPPIESAKHDYFFRVAEITGEVMNNLRHICGQGFIFFWVDAIFVFPEWLPIVENYLNDNLIEFKSYKIDKVLIESDYFEVISDEWKLKKEEKTNSRKFYLRKEYFDLAILKRIQKQIKK